jgi:hypothetical protein
VSWFGRAIDWAGGERVALRGEFDVVGGWRAGPSGVVGELAG